ncbi:MAG TPA: hypothetical protein VF179_25380 [Thermoanaerobaculia bacterium]|nr:hypothetical protein [Thermoanaerobaculia bacterium]
MSWPRDGHIVKGRTVEINLPWSALTAIKKTGTFIPASGWSLLADYTQIRGWGELAGATGDIKVTPAVQLATNPRNPGEVVTTSTTLDKEGLFEARRPVPLKGGKGKKGGGKAVQARAGQGKKGQEEGEQEATYVRVGWLVSSPSGKVVHASASGMIELSTDDE